jgi:hypothetical protein
MIHGFVLEAERGTNIERKFDESNCASARVYSRISV